MSTRATNLAAFRQFWGAFQHPDADAQRQAVAQFFSEQSAFNACHPINGLAGADGITSGFLAPLLDAFEGLYFRPDIQIGGQGYDGGDWVSGMGHLVGTFRKEWCGIAPTGSLVTIRLGDFHRIVQGRAVESYVYFDIPELLTQIGRNPLPQAPGGTSQVFGPATHDGLRDDTHDAARNTQTYKIMTDMLMGLATKDEAWRPYWHPNMMWYGPAAFGRYVGIEDFAGFQTPFEAAFEGWGGGLSPHTPTKHFTRFADGNYSCIGGWPSLQGTHTGAFLGFEPTGITTTFRVCDWYRLEGDKIVENWVFVDIPHMLLQWGYDLIAEAA